MPRTTKKMTHTRKFLSNNLSNRVSKLEKISKQAEFKFIDLSESSAVGTTAGLRLLNGVGGGVLDTSRQGNIIFVKSVQLAYTWVINTLATATQLRMIIVQDRQPNEVVFPIAQLLVLTNMTSFRNLDYRSRFIIHYDQVHSMSADGARTGSAKFYKRMNMKTTFDEAGNLIADITSNALFLVLISTEAVNFPNVEFNRRVRFTDS